MPRTSRPVLLAVAVLWTACEPVAPEDLPLAADPALGQLGQGISDPALRKTRSEIIRDAARKVGVTTGVLFAGIGEAETALSHCNHEVGYGCPGPASDTCGGRPVLAGGADGPCSYQQGGLGMFQFDRGTYQDTLNFYGPKVLLLEGNTELAVEYMIDRVILSTYIDGVSNRAEAIAWINSAGPGTPNYPTWLKTVTHYYNGCVPGRCQSYSQRYAKYQTSTDKVLNEQGQAFWSWTPPPPPPPPTPCAPVPPSGRIVEDGEPCYEETGEPQGWTKVSVGHGDAARWAPTTSAGAATRTAVWKLELEQAGRYAVEVYTGGPEYAQSRQARYEVVHAGQTTPVVLDQTASTGFHRLGEFDFAAGAGQSLRLADNTGEDGLRLGVDAIRLTAASLAPDFDGGQPVTPLPTPLPTQTGRVELEPITGGCSSTGTGSLVLAWLAAAVWLTRRLRSAHRS